MERKYTKKEQVEGLCFGEYGLFENCKTCRFREACKKFTSAEREVTLRYQGKYKGRGKLREKDRY